jgi:uncharacterized protein
MGVADPVLRDTPGLRRFWLLPVEPFLVIILWLSRIPPPTLTRAGFAFISSAAAVRVVIQVSHQPDNISAGIVSHDVRKFFRLLLKKNGYVLEQLFSPLIVHTTPEHQELKEICRTKLAGSETGAPGDGVITKHHAHHYLGFTATQWKLFEKEAEKRVKPLLYVFRVLLTGIHLMRSGELNANLVELNEEYRLPYVPDLIARKPAGEKTALSAADVDFYRTEKDRLEMVLKAASANSHLPEAPSAETRQALNDLLVRIRLTPRIHNAQ